MNKCDQSSLKSDKAGIFFSIACLLHCTALPLLSMIAPLTTSYLKEEWIHFLLLSFLIPVAIFSFVKGKNIHMIYNPIIIGIIGISCLILAIFSESFASHEWEKYLTIIGSFCLILAHGLNIKYQKYIEVF